MAGGNTFSVQSLGWTEFDENLLTPSTSSKAIQRCILELSSRDNAAPAKPWLRHDPRRMVLKIEHSSLKILDSNGSKLINLQPIGGIRVWGTNENNDFAYVARDPPPPMLAENQDPALMSPTSPTVPPILLKCHVYHCVGSPDLAQRIANLLKDEVTRLNNLLNPGRTGSLGRPQQLYIDDYNPSPITTPTAEFPTPLDEPRKTIVAKYLGRVSVLKPVGINIINDAINRVLQDIDAIRRSVERSNADIESNEPLMQEYVQNVVSLVHISPSTIRIESTVNGQLLHECRVRYVSFLGICKDNAKYCGFIVQISESEFEAHCFECEPNSGPLCKTIEAACKLRYQKCLDAHKQRCNALLNAADQGQSRPMASSATLAAVKNVLSKFWKQ